MKRASWASWNTVPTQIVPRGHHYQALKPLYRAGLDSASAIDRMTSCRRLRADEDPNRRRIMRASPARRAPAAMLQHRLLEGASLHARDLGALGSRMTSVLIHGDSRKSRRLGFPIGGVVAGLERGADPVEGLAALELGEDPPSLSDRALGPLARVAATATEHTLRGRQ